MADETPNETAAEIARLRKALTEFQALAVAAYAVVIYAIPTSDGADRVFIPREQFNHLTAALARVGLTH